MQAHPGGRQRPGLSDESVPRHHIFGVFSDVANRAATLVTTNPNFVKKAVFPLSCSAHRS